MWADRGECKNSKQYMLDHCKASCKYCTEKGPRPKDEVELHPLSVATISAEVGVKPAPAGDDAAATTATDAAAATEPKAAPTPKAAADAQAGDAAKQKPAGDAQAGDAAKQQVNAEKAAADMAAAEAQAAAAAAAKAATKAVDGPSEEEMRGKYAASTLSYAALVKRWGAT